MEKYYDADGNDITEKVKAQFQSQTEAKVKEVQDQLAAIQTENQKLKEKDANFDALKTKYEADTKDLTEKLTKLTTDVTTDKKNDAMRRFSGGNKEINDKIEAELKVLNLPMSNADEIESAITKAAAIVGVVQKNGAATVMAGIGGRGTAPLDTNTPTQETPEQRTMRLNFGITDEMAAKYYPADSGVTPLIIDKPKA